MLFRSSEKAKSKERKRERERERVSARAETAYSCRQVSRYPGRDVDKLSQLPEIVEAEHPIIPQTSVREAVSRA